MFASLNYLEQRYHNRGAFEDLDVIILLLFMSLLFVPSVRMTMHHACLAFKNLTTNELQNWRRYDYLLSSQNNNNNNDANVLFHNPFDKGIINNVYQRFFPKLQHQVIQISNSNESTSTSTLYSKYGSTAQDDIESISDTNYVTFA